MSENKGAVNKNRYSHKGVVVLKFENGVDLNGKPQIYATGYDLDNPKELLSIALMQEHGYKRQIAQYNFGVTEKKNGDTISYVNTRTHKPMSKEEYDDFLDNNPALQAQYSKLMGQRRLAENLLTKSDRTGGNRPTVLMFDNANKLGEVNGMSIYEAKWIRGIAGTSKNNEANDEFTMCHRKILGNINIKYDENMRPVWGDVRAIDRVANLTMLNPSMPVEEMDKLKEHNRSVILHALSNSLENDTGYKVERNPFTYLSIHNKKGEHQETISIYNEEEKSSRYKLGDSAVKFEFMRPLPGKDTLIAYLQKRDQYTLPVMQAIANKEALTMDVPTKAMLRKAFEADKVRIILSKMLDFDPPLAFGKDLEERFSDPEMKKNIAITSNMLKKLETDISSGETNVKMINGTTYPIGHKYLERFLEDASHFENGKPKPMAGIVNWKTENDQKYIVPNNDDRTIPFSPMYICPKKWDIGDKKASSVYTPLITVQGMSYDQVLNDRVKHTELTENHTASAESIRFIASEYKDYVNGVKQVPNVFELLKNEQERIEKIENERNRLMEQSVLQRLVGVNDKVEPSKRNEEVNHQPGVKKEQEMSFDSY